MFRQPLLTSSCAIGPGTRRQMVSPGYDLDVNGCKETPLCAEISTLCSSTDAPSDALAKAMRVQPTLPAIYFSGRTLFPAMSRTGVVQLIEAMYLRFTTDVFALLGWTNWLEAERRSRHHSPILLAA
nr:hypothetical protein CFP56_65903 [Quercus suber]